MGLPNEREKIVGGGSLRLSDIPEQFRDRNFRDWSFLAVEIARFAGLKFVDHIRFPMKMDEAKIPQNEMLTQYHHYCLDSFLRAIEGCHKSLFPAKSGRGLDWF